ncbi:MAG: hypothetical protein OQK24_03220 [Magnetovibrio sp.]|nr:hypothetical protein [Magnetovibrio sp.]
MTSKNQSQSTKDSLNDVDFMRQVEVDRLEVEKFIAKQEYTKTYLERWKLDVVDRRTVQINLAHSASDFGKFTLRSIFLLNGGAMIALPAFGQLVDKIDASLLSTSLGWFAGGLSVVTIAMLFAYFSLSATAISWRCAMDGSASSLNQEQAKEGEKDNFNTAIENFEKDRVRYNKYSDVFEFLAIIFAVAGLIAFIVGANSGASMLTG